MEDDGDTMLEENNDDIYDIPDDAVVEAISEEEEEDIVPREITKSDIQEILIVKDENRMTSDRISLYEYTETVGARAEAISRFNNCMVDITGLTDPIKMAEREFRMRKCPLLIQREIGTKVIDGVSHIVYEYLNPNTAIHPARSHVEGGF
jgi:DNA-directed RNA polymerase I, II, and III subunit RPABC2